MSRSVSCPTLRRRQVFGDAASVLAEFHLKVHGDSCDLYHVLAHSSAKKLFREFLKKEVPVMLPLMSRWFATVADSCSRAGGSCTTVAYRAALSGALHAHVLPALVCSHV